MQEDDSLARLSRVAVDPALRGRGIGPVLVSAMIDKARRSGIRILDLRVYGSNVRARRLYARLGFKGSGRDSKEPAMVALMRKEL